MMKTSPLNFRRTIIWIGRLALGGILVYAGYAKLTYPNHTLWPWFMLKFSVSANLSTFAFQVESYKVLGAAGSALVALAVLITVFAFQEARGPHPWTAAKT